MKSNACVSEAEVLRKFGTDRLQAGGLFLFNGVGRGVEGS